MSRKCPNCQAPASHSSRLGHFVRRSDKRKFKRFRCKCCLKTFSKATFHKCYRQKKRRLNPRIFELLCSGVSQRRISKLLKISRTTVARKFEFLGAQTNQLNLKQFNSSPSVFEMQFDDLETIEHTKMKPLSVTMAVEKRTRRILGFEVSRMPAKGLLARKARVKYGPRRDERAKNRELLFQRLLPKIAPTALIESDENPHYHPSVKKWFPRATYRVFKGQRGCVTGQGELKKIAFDPLFSLNHTYAMLRANINRLFRKTWCTTKRPERLYDHINLYVFYHNNRIIEAI